MLQILQLLTVMIVAAVLALGLAHARELPGKQRFPNERYLALQRIYYPGFTYVVSTEPVSLLMILLLLLVTPAGSVRF